MKTEDSVKCKADEWTVSDTIEVIELFVIIAIFVAILVAGIIFFLNHAPSKVYLPWQPRI